MDINLNMNLTIKAPELCASINNLAASLVMSKTTGFVADTTTDKSNFTFKVADAANVELPAPYRNDDATQVNRPAPETEQTEDPKDNSAENTDKSATKEPKKDDGVKVTREMIRAKLKSKVDAGKQPEVKALLNSYGVSKLPDVPEDKFAELMAKAEAL